MSGVVLQGDWQLIWSARTSHGTAFLNQAGDLAFVEPRHMIKAAPATHKFPTHGFGVRLVAGHPHSPYVAIGSRTGTVWWWDLRTMLPSHVGAGTRGLCSFDRDWIYAQDADSLELVAIPR